MPKLPIIWLRTSEPTSLPDLLYHRPALSLTGLQLGVDNLRHDVSLSPSFVKDLTAQISRYICRFGEVENFLGTDMALPANGWQFAAPLGQTAARPPGLAELKSSLIAAYQAILSRAKVQGNPSIDLLGRLAVLKFIRSELQAQFSKILEQCRIKAKSLDGMFVQNPLQVREQLSFFQVRKKIVIRRAGQEILHLLSDIEKETLARTRRSLIGQLPAGTNRLFLNPLVFTEDGQDDYICAEHYYMFGNFERDPDRFSSLRELALTFLRDLGYGEGMGDEQLEQALNVPENAHALVGDGYGGDAAEERQRNDRLEVWTRMLQRHNTMAQVVASYEAVPLLADYAPRVNPQQLKNALIDRDEAERVETMIREGRLASDRLRTAIGRVSSCRESGRRRFAARLLHDLCCYHRDLRGLEAVNAGFDSVNLVADPKTRELSALNGMLYEFLPPEDQKPAEERILGHVILKADVRDSSRLTRSLMEKGMNAASYFSLNFYDPVNKLLAKFGATKVFLEGDAIILALLEREAEVNLAVSRACVLAWEMVSLLHGYNELLRRSGLPSMEVGLGIAYQDSPPLYLMDGEHRIMISDAINLSDRLSSCAKRVRKRLAEEAGVFQVYTLQLSNKDALAGAPTESLAAEELRLNYNVGGICLSEPAFLRLRHEITLTGWRPDRNTPGFGGPWVDPEGEFFLGTVPVAPGSFRRIAIRKGRIAQVDVRDLSILRWTDLCYYEVCANPAVYSAMPGEKSATARNA
jgi:hypothetical protein